MNLKVKESAEYFDIYSAQGHIMARIPKNIPDLAMTVSVFSHCIVYLAVLRMYVMNETPDLKAFAEEVLVQTKEVEEKYIGAFNN